MKICQINCVYGEGSTGKLTRDIHVSLQEHGYDSIVIYGVRHHEPNEEGTYHVSNKYLSYASAILRRCFGMQYDWALLQSHKIINILKREQPDVVHLQCINGNDINIYRLLRYLAENKIKTVYTLHAEFPYTGGCGHAYACKKWKSGCGHCPILREATQSPWIDGTHRTWRKQKEAYERFDTDKLIFTAVSPWLKGRAEMSPLLQRFNKVVVMNGVDTTIFHPYKGQTWRSKLGIGQDEDMILFVTAHFNAATQNLKGGRYVVELAKIMPDKKFVVTANFGQAENLPANLIYVGRTTNQQELAQLYSEATLTILTSSRETFSMPVAESQCCGTPIVGFKAGGPESIALTDFSEFCDYGDIGQLKQLVEKWSRKEYNLEELASSAKATYSKETMTRGYMEVYQHM